MAKKSKIIKPEAPIVPKNDIKDKKQPDPSLQPQNKKSIPINNPYELPPNIGRILNEHSCGFVLMTIDHNGNTNFMCKHDNEIIGEALERKLLDILTIRQEILQARNEQQVLDSMGLLGTDDSEN